MCESRAGHSGSDNRVFYWLPFSRTSHLAIASLSCPLAGIRDYSLAFQGLGKRVSESGKNSGAEAHSEGAWGCVVVNFDFPLILIFNLVGLIKHLGNWVWWHMPGVPGLGRQRQEDCHSSEASFMSSHGPQKLHSETKSLKKKKRIN